MLAEQLQLGPEDVDGKRLERFLAACGVDAVQAAQLTCEARASIEQADTVLLEVHLADGSPRATLRPDNVASLRTAQTARRAVVGAVQ